MGTRNRQADLAVSGLSLLYVQRFSLSLSLSLSLFHFVAHRKRRVTDSCHTADASFAKGKERKSDAVCSDRKRASKTAAAVASGSIVSSLVEEARQVTRAAINRELECQLAECYPVNESAVV